MSMARAGYFTIQPLGLDHFLNHETLRFDTMFDPMRHAFITNLEAQNVAKEVAERDKTTLRIVLRHKNHSPYGEFRVSKDGVERAVTEAAQRFCA